MLIGRSTLLDWIKRDNDGRYALYFEFFEHLPVTSKFWEIYELEYQRIEPRKRSLFHYLLMAAVQLRALNEPESDLAKYFPASPSFDPHISKRAIGVCFDNFCQVRWSVLANIAHSHEVQINKLGRNSLLAPLFVEAASRLPPSAAYVEVGASVGLSMLWPHLSFNYNNGKILRGPLSRDETILSCGIQGIQKIRLAGSAPVPASLVGIDTHPLDARNHNHTDWLKALVAPNDASGRKSLHLGLSLTKKHTPNIIKGCVLERLPDIEANLSLQQPLIVYHSMTLHQLVEAGKLPAWRTLLRQIAARRPVIEISVSWEEGDPTSMPWPVEMTITEWSHPQPLRHLIGWTDQSADGTYIKFAK
jgi:hypothetical protein